MLSERLSAEDTLRLGLIDHVTQDLRDAMQAFAEKRKPRFNGV
jgi:enoyl-CoA hydratase/carnithine racemase